VEVDTRWSWKTNPWTADVTAAERLTSAAVNLALGPGDVTLTTFWEVVVGTSTEKERTSESVPSPDLARTVYVPVAGAVQAAVQELVVAPGVAVTSGRAWGLEEESMTRWSWKVSILTAEVTEAERLTSATVNLASAVGDVMVMTFGVAVGSETEKATAGDVTPAGVFATTE
jgi:hypothetical protein